MLSLSHILNVAVFPHSSQNNVVSYAVYVYTCVQTAGAIASQTHNYLGFAISISGFFGGLFVCFSFFLFFLSWSKITHLFGK